MSAPAIRAQGVSKRFRIGGGARYKSLRESLQNAAASAFRRRGRAEETIWALRDVSFEVAAGEAVGVIGRNGAGKSTLLKILSRITEPTEGRIELRGRVGSLLEVGTGFHLELTGRENIYLSGAILGMRRTEIVRRFDEIVAFAEVDRFLDTPVKHYSTGMYLRLAFAVAAHLEPEILLVDEVLAVGDAEFQKKCLGKMGDVTQSGRTVIFVSHNMGAVLRLCGRCVWLDRGRVRTVDEGARVVRSYLGEGDRGQAEVRFAFDAAPGDDSLRVLRASVCQPDAVPCANIDIERPFSIEIEADVQRPTKELTLAIRVLTADGTTAIHTCDLFGPERGRRQTGRWLTRCALPAHTLNAGNYVVSLAADEPNRRLVLNAENLISFRVEATSTVMGRYHSGAWHGILGPGLPTWSTRQLTAEMPGGGTCE